MRHFSIFIVSTVILFNACSTPGSTAVSFLWNEEPEPTSTRVMVMSGLTGEELRAETIRKLEAVGFVVEDFNENLIVTEPMDLVDGQLIISVELNDNAIILSADKGPVGAEDDDGWEPVLRGPGDHSSSEWNLLEVIANSIEHTTIRYND